MIYKKTLRKVGNSWGFTLNKTHLEMLNYDPEKTVLEFNFDTANQRITIQPVKRPSIFEKKERFDSGT